MTIHSYPVEVQTDHLQKITKARPVQAIAELIWNALDADATDVRIIFTYNDLYDLSEILVIDNGIGIPHDQAPDVFKHLGGSWKHPGGTTQRDGRFLHGQDGRGRFKALALGRIVEWSITYERGDRAWTYTASMDATRIREVEISDETPAPSGSTVGVTVRISELHRDWQINTHSAAQELNEIFALYLSDYRSVSVELDGERLDPENAISSRKTFDMGHIGTREQWSPVALEVIEWRRGNNRALYLCSENGFPLRRIERKYHGGARPFSAYLRSSLFSAMQREGTLDLAEMRSDVTELVDRTHKEIKAYFRELAAAEAQSLVEEWKSTNVYPYRGEAGSRVERVERQVFDIVAVSVAQHVADFESTAPAAKAFHLRMLRQAIENSPEDLQLILDEVLNLPKKQQEELADLLKNTSLSAVIGAAKLVADRLKFLSGLELVLFDPELKKRLKERSQLHRIVAQNAWLFGEEFNLSVDDRSLTEVLRKHLKAQGMEGEVDAPVRHVSKTRGIVDLMLSRAIRRHSASDLTHLVVELKAPKVKVDAKEIVQIEEYANSVMADERFRGLNVCWSFWLLCDDYGSYARSRIGDSNTGMITTRDNFRIYVKTWAQVLEDNRSRLQFFQEKLEYQVDRDTSLTALRLQYGSFLEGVLVEEDDLEDAPGSSTAAADAPRLEGKSDGAK
jgi:hypothetical protein